MTNKENLLEVHNLKKYFPIQSGVFFKKNIGNVKAIDDVSFSLEKGATLGIVGESGCGKSTMGKCLLRLIEPTSGTVLFNGKNIAELNAEELRAVRRHMQFVFQDPYASLNPRMTVGDILEEPLLIRNIGGSASRRETVLNLLNVVGLDRKHIDCYPHEFSGGQRQRIAIGRALVTRPELIVADEAVSALDVSIQAQILNLLQDLQQEYGLTYIFISHDLSVIRHISTNIGVMYLGKMMELATKDEIFDNPLHPYTQGLLAAAPRLDRKRERKHFILETDIPSASNPPSGCVFHTRCSYCMDICKQKSPELKKVKEGHLVACHYLSKDNNA